MRLLLATSLCWLASPVRAHELQIATAQVSLRDGQIAVVAHVDLLAQLEALQPPGAEVSVGLLAIADPEAFARLAERARASLRADTSLEVDGARVAPESWRIPSVSSLRQAAQRGVMVEAIDGPGAPPALSAIAFEVRIAARPQSVSLALPAEVGPVLVQFVEPASQLVRPGRAATLRLQPAPISAAPPSSPRGPGAAP